MKKHLILLISIVLSLSVFTSCLNEYLDVSPESGLTDQEVFSKYENFKKFFDYIYTNDGPASISTSFRLHWSFSTQKFTMEAMTDATDAARLMLSQPAKQGTISPTNLFNDWSEGGSLKYGWFNPMWRATRIANIALEKVNMIQNITPEDKYDLIAQAYFVRGFCLFEAFRSWGPMPHITKPLGPDDLWDIPRPTKNQSCMYAAQDMDSAIVYFQKAGRMRRDPGPGQAGHLNSPDQFRPSGMSALAIKARILLYAASPLNNERGVEDWKNAAKVNWEAIQKSHELGYELLSFPVEYKKNFNGARYSNEQLYGWYGGSLGHTNQFLQWLIAGVLRGGSTTNSADCPTQNMVDKYETIYGDPLQTEEQRNAAIAAGRYSEQDPYANRDPRLDFSVVCNQSQLTGWLNGKAQIYIENVNGVIKYGELLDPVAAGAPTGVTQTGYYQRKRWGGESVKNKVNSLYTDPVIRLAELYLNYAEAANEAYGPNVAVPGAGMTAVEAINVIRNRVGMPNVLSQFTTTKEIFRERIKNERNVELAFEGHYFYDIRRWLDAPTVYSGIIYGMNIEKVPVSAEFPTGFKYSRAPLPSNRQQRWREAMWYFPFQTSDYRLMKNFVAGEIW
jgi:hypothetical protein